MNIIAIDPGKGGGIVSEIHGRLEFSNMPETPAEIFAYILTLQAYAKPVEIVAVMEKLPKFAGKIVPGSCIAVLFENYGVIKGVLAALEIPTTLIEPQIWQGWLHIGRKKDCSGTTEWKNKLKTEAIRRMPPDTNVTLKTADAALILEWGKAHL